MRHYLLLLLIAAVVSGCVSVLQEPSTWVEVWLENEADVKVSSVATGADDYHSDFGILGSKGAGKTAVVGVRFTATFPIEWEENFDGKTRRATVDLRSLADVKNRAIILAYNGNGRWEARPGRTIRPQAENR